MAYTPSDGATPVGLAFTRLLSQRDLSLQIPVNYVNVAGISLTAACFSNRTYEDAATATCLSNLLAVGFRRIEIDLYWDSSLRSWTLCPAELATLPENAQQSSSSEASLTGSSNASNASASLTGRGLDNIMGIWRRQTEAKLPVSGSSTAFVSTTAFPSVTSTAIVSGNVSTTGFVPTGSASGLAPYPEPINGGTLFQVGPYQCTSTVNLSLVSKIIVGHFENTAFSINATTKYLVLNLHAAVTVNDPAGSPPKPATSDLPDTNSQLSSILQTNLSSFIYGPADLLQERADLNMSWYSALRTNQPDPAYYSILHSGGHASTPDGWPSENYMELQKEQRLLVGFGELDPQMADYNRTADSSTIFDAGYLETLRNITTTNTGQINNGCFLDSGSTSLSDANSSWAIPQPMELTRTDADSLDISLAKASSLTTCGISPVLNQTLSSSSAGTNYSLYASYVQSTIWSWAANEPRNSSAETSQNTSPNCAAMNSSNSGRWQVADCLTAHYAACRVGSAPYEWKLSNQKVSYANVNASCRDNTTFAVPRTALENAYLSSALNAAQQAGTFGVAGDDLLWLNFNQLHVPSCWVIGQNTTCPYQPTEMNVGRTVVVPTVAAIIVFVLAALTVFVKCAANRRSSKRRRRRGDDGWDYEGMPS